MRKGLLQWRPVLLGAIACSGLLSGVSAQDVDSLAIPIRKGGSENNTSSSSKKNASNSAKSESKSPAEKPSSEKSSSEKPSSRSKSSDRDSELSFYTASASERAESSARSESKASEATESDQSRRSSAQDADMAAVSNLRSVGSSGSSKSSEDEEQEKSDSSSAAASNDEEVSSDEQAISESATEVVSVPGPATALPEVPYVPTPAATVPQPNMYVQPSTESRGLLSRLFGRKKVTSTSPARIPTNFTSDYTKRDPNMILPAVLSGNGINGQDIPIGSEDPYRLASALPTDFRPTDLVQIPMDYSHYGNQLYLRSEAAAALCKMIYDAQCQGLNIKVVSAFRDYGHQLRLYNQSVARRGSDQKAVARPGKSEHFLGTTVDLTNSKEHTLKRSFGDTPEGRWLAANAHRYGWKMTVMSGEGRRSHNDEPWHLRYLGSAVNSYSRNSVVAQPPPQSQPRDVMGKIGRFLGLRR